jgi:glycosyltransferase involved in cell wall biosynthesis
MPPEPDTGDAEVRDLRMRLDAEQAAADHWRRIALQRSEEFATLAHRPAVRALVAVERRVAPIGARARFAGRGLKAAAERVALGAGAVRRIGRRRSPDLLVGRAPAGGRGPTQRAAVVVVGSADPPWAGGLSPGVEVTRVVEPGEAGAALARAIEASAPDLVGVVAGTSEPPEPGWLDRLAAAIGGSTVAAVPLIVHPRRPLRSATPHDGLVRAAGVGLSLSDDGVPRARAVGAGTTPRPEAAIADVAAGSGTALLVDRAAYQSAGGLAATDDLDAAAVELCVRLRASGARVVVVPGAVVVDHRPVRARRELEDAVDLTGPGWAAAIDRSGAALRRAADPRLRPPLRLAITVAAPSAKVAARWGDWHLAQALAGSLRRLGTEVRVQTADQADDPAGRSCDVHVVLRGLQSLRSTAGQRQVLWVVSHPETIEDEELAAADLVLVASPRFAEHLQGRTDTPVDVLLQATDHRRFSPRPVDPAHRHDVTIVAKTRDVLRPAVADALAAGLRPRLYGGGWRTLVDPELVVADHIDNEVLPTVYSSAGVVLNDHWRTMRAWGFVSNRLFDVLACGTPVISDPVDGIDELFDGAVLDYRTPDDLRELVDDVLGDPAQARRRAEGGRRLVLAGHTVDHRARQLLEHLAR